MTAIFFSIDGPGRKAQAALLAATLVHHNGQRFHLIAYVPDRQRSGPLRGRVAPSGRRVPVAGKRPWLDRISLPVTLKRHGLDYVLATGR